MRILFIAALLLISTNFQAQSPKQRITDGTVRSYGLEKSTVFNNSIYSLGFHETSSSTSRFPCIFKQDFELNTEWVDRIIRPADVVSLTRMVVSSDDRMMLAGVHGDIGDVGIWLVKFDPGEYIPMEKEMKIAGDQSVSQFLENGSGGGLVVGIENTSMPKPMLLIDVDVNGDTNWTKKLTLTSGDDFIAGPSYKEAGGNYIVSHFIQASWVTELMKISSTGDLLDHYYYTDNAGIDLSVSCGYNDGQYTYLAGEMSGGDWTSFIMKVDSNGEVIWCNNYTEIQRIHGVKVVADGNLIVQGRKQWGPYINREELVKLDTNGMPLIAKAYGELPAEHWIPSTGSFLELNNHLILSGKRQYQAIKTGYQLCVDQNLNSGSCYQEDINLTVNPLNIIKVSLTGVNISSLGPDIVSYGNVTVNNSYLLGTASVNFDLGETILTEIEVVGDDCGGVCIGQATVSALGGNPAYTFNWSNGQTGPTATELCADDNVVLITGDQLGCYVYDTIVVPQMAPVTEVCMVTVDTTSTKNEVVWEKPITNAIEGFVIHREIVGNYTVVGYVPYDSLSKFVDHTNGVNPNITSYRYKISTIDTCGNESDLSDYHETIHLTVNQGSGSIVNLIWDNYEGFAFSYNRILRDSLGDGNWRAIDSVANSVFTWTDANSPLPTTGYMIEVVTPNTCTSTKAQDHNTTRSNRHTSIGPSGSTSINEMILSQTSIYPNPNNGLFTINVASENWSYSLFDISGKLISNESVSETNKEVDVRELETGIYLMKINLGESSIYKKIMKQ